MSLRVKTEPELAERLRDARERAMLTQVELAQQLNVSPRTVQNWEAGIVPQPKHRRVLAAFIEASEAKAA
jgi:DNA-binding transcriptional regulator YiaG